MCFSGTTIFIVLVSYSVIFSRKISVLSVLLCTNLWEVLVTKGKKNEG